MLEAYLSAAFQTWAARMTDNRWRGFWRLKKLGIDWQLKSVQKIGTEIELSGPVIIKNLETIEVSDQVKFDATWHKPVYISLMRPNARLIIENNA
jgi:hypothetical protein